MTQGHLIVEVGAMHKSRHMRSLHKMLGSFGIMHISVPQVPSDELNTAKQVLPGGKKATYGTRRFKSVQINSLWRKCKNIQVFVFQLLSIFSVCYRYCLS